jgi:hypothetical protein
MTHAYLYKWTHLPTGKWYVGSKSSKGCSPEIHEKYICSSKIVKPMVKEHREEWIYQILVISNPRYIRQLEKLYLRALHAKDDPMSFNQSNASCEYDKTGMKDSFETRHRKSLSRRGEKNPSYGKRGEKSPLFNRPHSESTKEKQSIGVKLYAAARPASHNENISKALKGNPNVGIKGSRNPSFGKSEVAKHINDKPPKTCPHCLKTMNLGNYARYHGDKCKKYNANE